MGRRRLAADDDFSPSSRGGAQSRGPVEGVTFGNMDRDRERLEISSRKLLRLPKSLRPLFHISTPMRPPALRPRLCKADLEVLVNLLRYPWVPDLHSHLSPLSIDRHDGHVHLHGTRSRSVVASKV